MSVEVSGIFCEELMS